MLNNDTLLTLGVAVGSGEGSTSTVGGGGRVFGRGPCRRTGRPGGLPRLHLEGRVGTIICKRGRVLGRNGHFSFRVYTWNA